MPIIEVTQGSKSAVWMLGASGLRRQEDLLERLPVGRLNFRCRIPCGSRICFCLRKTPAPQIEFYEASQVDQAIKILSRKYFSFVFSENMICFTHSAADERGVSRSSRHVVRNAVDVDGRLTSGKPADGEVVWSWRAPAGAKLATMQTHRGLRRRQTLVHRGEHL